MQIPWPPGIGWIIALIALMLCVVLLVLNRIDPLIGGFLCVALLVRLL